MLHAWNTQWMQIFWQDKFLKSRELLGRKSTWEISSGWERYKIGLCVSIVCFCVNSLSTELGPTQSISCVHLSYLQLHHTEERVYYIMYASIILLDKIL